MRSVLSFDGNGVWLESMLSYELQTIFAKHRNQFNGEPVREWWVETESYSEKN